MHIACLDLEGVLVPEIWISIAEHTGIEGLRLTTRDIPDYDVLMKQRLALLEQHDLRIDKIAKVIEAIKPLPGALGFLRWLRERYQIVIVSDTYYEFAAPLLRRLRWPTLLCNCLDIDNAGRIVNYRVRQPDPKRQAVAALHALKFHVIAAGDSYNDLGMLTEADVGILFRPPERINAEYPQFPVARTYNDLQAAFLRASS